MGLTSNDEIRERLQGVLGVYPAPLVEIDTMENILHD